MINKSVVEDNLTNVYANRFFHSIVYESFMNALPVDKSLMTKDERHNLFFYTDNIVRSIGGIKAVEAAIDLKNKTPEQNLFIAGIYNTCMESARECAKKKCNDPSICSKEDKMSDVLDKATLSKEDCRKFAERANTMKLDDVAEIIKKKTLQVISDEKEQYKKDQDLDNELADALNENDSMDDLGESDLGDDLLAEESSDKPTLDPIEIGKAEASAKFSKKLPKKSNVDSAVEAFKNFHLNATDPRHHVSVFSRLQDNAMEVMSYIETSDYGRNYFPILDKVTFESFFSKPNVMMAAATESAITQEEVCEVPAQTRPKVATLVSIITYTIMETLHTMGIFTPAKNNIQSFVNSSIDAENLKKKSVSETCDGIKCAVKESANLDFSKMSSMKLGNKLATLKTALEGTQEFIDKNGASTEIINVASEAVTYIQEIEDILSQRAKDNKALSEATESYQTRREKEHDLAQFNRISGLFKANPNISEIKLCVNPDHMQSVIDVQCANESGKVIRTSYMNIEYACESDQYLRYLDDTYKKSNLSKINKDVCIKLMDGKGTTIKL